MSDSTQCALRSMAVRAGDAHRRRAGGRGRRGGRGGGGGGFGGGGGGGGPEFQARMLERFKTMSPDEQQQFLARMKERGGDTSAFESGAAAGARRRARRDAAAPQAQTIDALFAPLPVGRIARARVALHRQPVEARDAAARHQRRHLHRAAVGRTAGEHRSRHRRHRPRLDARHADAGRQRQSADAWRAAAAGGRPSDAAAVAERELRRRTERHLGAQPGQDLRRRRAPGEGAARRQHRSADAASSSRSRGRRAPASPRSCTSSAASTGRRRASIFSTARTCRRCRRTSWPRCATRRSDSCSRDSTCCRARRRSTTSNCRCSTAARR